MTTVVYGGRPETPLRSAPRASSRTVNYVLLGTYLEVVRTRGPWLFVRTRRAGRPGWAHVDDVRDTPVLKVFYVDVGQGDGAIVEHPGGIMLIDGGPNTGYHRFLSHRYAPLFEENGTVHIDAVVVSHPDADHFGGLTPVLRDRRFTFGRIYHNGIVRYDDDDLPPGRSFDLGRLRNRTVDGETRPVLGETFSTLAQAGRLVDDGHLMRTFERFWEAALGAHHEGRLRSARRITSRDATLPRFDVDPDDGLRVEVYGPVPTRRAGPFEYVGFPATEDLLDANPPVSSSHTRNGHSLVLKLVFGSHSFLFGGDLNIPAQLHLMRVYGEDNPFRVDVAKACHHGSSDFHVEFLKRVRPRANVVSSGDNKSFDHPMADALGSMARHTRGDHPLLFATELARAVSSRGIHYGLVNARSDGRVLALAQMKEQHARKADVWDSFTVPWPGRFKDVLDAGITGT